MKKTALRFWKKFLILLAVITAILISCGVEMLITHKPSVIFATVTTVLTFAVVIYVVGKAFKVSQKLSGGRR